MSKYHNRKTTYYGETFDSQKEADYWLYLKAEERAGNITDLKRQMKFELVPKMSGEYRSERAVYYVADFTYYDKAGKWHVVDVKGMKTELYKLKRKLMLYRKGISVEEV